jgi:hypothetical protein
MTGTQHLGLGELDPVADQGVGDLSSSRGDDSGDQRLATSPRKTRRRMRERAQSGSCKVSDRTFPRIQIQPLS